MMHQNIPAFLQYGDVKDSYARKAVSFQSGNNTLKGSVYGEGNDKGLVVIAPGKRDPRGRIFTGSPVFCRSWLARIFFGLHRKF